MHAQLPDNVSILIARSAERYRLPARLVAAIVRVESGGDTWAMRYEPGFYDRYVAGKNNKRFGFCSRETEDTARATSYGLMQIMGQVARERGFTGPFLSELCDPFTGLEYGCNHLAFLANKLPAPVYGWDAVCAAYNGGLGAIRGPQQFRNPEYVAKVLDALDGTWPVRGVL